MHKKKIIIFFSLSPKSKLINADFQTSESRCLAVLFYPALFQGDGRLFNGRVHEPVGLDNRGPCVLHICRSLRSAASIRARRARSDRMLTGKEAFSGVSRGGPVSSPILGSVCVSAAADQLASESCLLYLEKPLATFR